MIMNVSYDTAIFSRGMGHEDDKYIMAHCTDINPVEKPVDIP